MRGGVGTTSLSLPSRDGVPRSIDRAQAFRERFANGFCVGWLSSHRFRPILSFGPGRSRRTSGRGSCRTPAANGITSGSSKSNRSSTHRSRRARAATRVCRRGRGQGRTAERRSSAAAPTRKGRRGAKGDPGLWHTPARVENPDWRACPVSVAFRPAYAHVIADVDAEGHSIAVRLVDADAGTSQAALQCAMDAHYISSRKGYCGTAPARAA
jgi:hypothetical protein